MRGVTLFKIVREELLTETKKAIMSLTLLSHSLFSMQNSCERLEPQSTDKYSRQTSLYLVNQFDKFSFLRNQHLTSSK